MPLSVVGRPSPCPYSLLVALLRLTHCPGSQVRPIPSIPASRERIHESISHWSSRLHRHGHDAVAARGRPRCHRLRQRSLRALHLRCRRDDRRRAHHIEGRARPGEERSQGRRRRHSPRCPLQRPARQPQPRHHLLDQPPRFRAPGQGRQGCRRRPLPARLLVLQLRPGRRRSRGRDGRAEPRHRLRPVQGVVGARHRPARRRQLLPHLSAPGHGLRPVAAHALRHRLEQPRRLGRHHRADLPEVGWVAVAPDRAHRGHLARLHRRAGRSPREGAQRGVQRRLDHAELPHPRDRRHRRRGRARLPPRVRGRCRTRHALLSRELRQDRPRAAGLQAAVGRAQGGRAGL